MNRLLWLAYLAMAPWQTGKRLTMRRIERSDEGTGGTHMKSLRVCTFFLICATVTVSMATRPFPNMFLVKSNGVWSLSGGQLCGWAIFVENDDTKTKQCIGVREVLPAWEFEWYQTTAGPLWGKYALYYFARLGDQAVFRVRTCYQTDVLIDLEAAKVVDAKAWQTRLKELDQAEIRTTLKQAVTVMKSPGLKRDQADKVHAALVHAIHYEMVDCVPAIRELESVDYSGDGILLPSGWGPLTKQPPLDREAGYWHYTFYETRRLASLALRRLGATPKGFAALGFLRKDRTEAISPAVRREALPKVKAGLTPKAVYEAMGPPDYVLVDAWRYDIDGDKPYTARVVWDTDGIVKNVETISPPLWRQDLRESIGR